MAECLKLNLLLKIADCWSVDEAAWVFDCFESDIRKELFTWNKFVTDVETLRAADHGMARSVSLTFYGGPYGKLEKYQGSFAMFVVDRILISGKDWDWLLYFNSDSTTHIAAQNLKPARTPPRDHTDWIDSATDYTGDGQATEFIEVKGQLCSLNSEGRQVSQTCCRPEEKDDGTVRRWTSSGQVVVREGNDGKLD